MSQKRRGKKQSATQLKPSDSSRASGKSSLLGASATLLNLVPAGVCLASLEGIIVFQNERFAALFLSEEDRLGCTLAEVVLDPTLLARVSVANLYQLDGLTDEICLDTSSTLLKVTYRVVPLAHNTQEYLLIVCEDISEQALLRGKLSQMQEMGSISHLALGLVRELGASVSLIENKTLSLEDSITQLSLLVSLCHELSELPEQHPATAIKAEEIKLVSRALRLTTLVENISNDLILAKTSTERVSNYISSLRQLATSESNGKEECDVNLLIEDTLQDLKPEDKGCFCFSLNLDASLPMIECFQVEFVNTFKALIQMFNSCLDAPHSRSGLIPTMEIETAHSPENNEIYVGIRCLFANITQEKAFSSRASLAEKFQAQEDILHVIYTSITETQNGSFQIEIPDPDEIVVFIGLKA